ncbi:MAG: hypothetical protein KBF06_02320 [Bacteroidales bacterium]|jgi:predicted helicase|nr:hypothetical protein [Bacteroidales bacterium]MDI9573253.1 hypothetical protein [Bacteroidota bacterium]OQC59570.1 MAG: hypothetical protein BWX51_01479 [Bacteroidetes bacterium ADurb.Bin012]MBP9511306.1 hypothetical protein [Bacteroidales bacterium]MBP9588161.1 hypothetical protein [Bacteroidales bacterium]
MKAVKRLISTKRLPYLLKIYGRELTPEVILSCIYAVFYSIIYREKYTELLKIDFSRVPFPKDYKVFSKMAALVNELKDLHLMQSGRLDKLVSKYGGESDRIDMIVYRDSERRFI